MAISVNILFLLEFFSKTVRKAFFKRLNGLHTRESV